MAVTSPFKFLDAYAKEDKNVFFGRDEEVERLYELVFQSNLTLVYGQSGTGKTSLVQCGLANRFNATHWFDIYIRRNENINASLLNAVKQPEIQEEESGTLRERLMKKRQHVERTVQTVFEHENEIVRRLRLLYKHYLKPVYLIFDQFEELFILGDKSEQEAFYKNIANILETEAYCRVIIVMREESIAQLYQLEKVAPLLFEKRLRVEPLSRAKTEEVIEGTVAQFGIALENEALAGQIVDLLAEGQGRVELTHLQVFLDQLYQEAAPSADNGVVFTSDLIRRVGSIENILGDFLERQMTTLQNKAEEKYPGISSSAVHKALSAFVTLEGTKRPVSKESVKVSNLSDEQTGYIVDQLEKSRLLRYENDLYELSHDILARHIAETRTADEVALLRIGKIVKDRFHAFGTTRILLNNSEIQLIHSFRRRLEEENSLTPNEWLFVRQSVQANRRRRVFLAGLVLIIVAALAGLSLYSNNQRRIAQQNAALADARLREMLTAQEQQKAANYEKYLNEGKAMMATSRYSEAIQAFQTALDFDSLRREARDSLAVAQDRIGASSRFEQLIREGDALFTRNDDALYVDALAKYREARRLNFNNSLAQSKINATNGKLAVAFEKFKADGDAFYNAGTDFGYRMALESYRQAARIRPADAYIQRRIRETEARMSNDE